MSRPDPSQSHTSGNSDPSLASPFAPPEQAPTSDVKKAYNVVTDTVTGVNLRWSDNKFQAVFVAGSVVVLAPLGAALAALNPSWNLPWFGGAGIGTFAGLIFGVFTSGIWLGIYRFLQHLRGRHD